MKHIVTLTRMQLGSAFEFISFKKKKDKRKQMSALTVLVLGFLLFSFISFSYSMSMGVVMQTLGELDVLPGFLMAITCFITLITTINKVKGTLFGFKDYDLVMSLPVTTSAVVASRVLLLYIINMFFSVVIMIPGIIVYGYLARPSVIFYVLSVISVLFIPLIPIIIASIIGTVLAVIASRFKYSNAINLILSIVFFMFIMFGMMFIQSDQQLVEIGKIIRNQMNQIYPLAGLYLQGIIETDIIAYLSFVVISVIAFAAFSVLIGKIFKRLNSGIMAKRVATNFKLKEVKQVSSLKALYKKEIKRYFSTSIYVMNTGFGLIILILGSIALFFIKSEQINMILASEEMLTMIQKMLPFGIAFLVAMASTTSSSISLEGKNLWIIKSSPIRVRDWFLSKMLVNLTLTIPTVLIGGVLLGIHFKLNALQMIISILIGMAYSYFTAVFGLAINLKFPMFDWTNETVVVKQSAASMIGVLSPMLTVGIPMAVLFVVSNINYELLIAFTIIIVLGVSVALHINLNRKANQIMAKL